MVVIFLWLICSIVWSKDRDLCWQITHPWEVIHCNTVQQLSVWTQTPAHRSTDNLESFLISHNYTEGLIVLCSPWKWNMLHWGLMVKDIACRSYIIERSWMSNQWEKMQQKQQYTSPQSYTASSPLWASQQKGTCVMWCTKVPEGGVHWQVLYSTVLAQTAAL